MAKPEQRSIVFRLHAEPWAHDLEVRGDLIHWHHGLAMRPANDGWHERSVALAPGTYAYKFHVGGAGWRVDPDNPRTRAVDGVQNSLLVVGGTDEPILHAPATPHLWRDEDGRLVVRAGLRRGDGSGLWLRWTDSGGALQECAMAHVADEDEHRFYEARVPASARAIEYLFRLEDGRCLGAAGASGQVFRVPVPPLPGRTPAWWRDAVLYTVLLDRFRRADTGGGWPGPAPGQERAGGDLRGVIEGLDHLVDLGVTALHLTPVVVAPSSHRYDAIDPRAVDPALGGEPALARLFDACHARGLRVLLDVAATHVHRDFFAFRDVRARGRASPYWDWFRIARFPFLEGPSPGYEHYQKGQWQEPLLDTNQPEVADYLVATFEHWTRLGADGFRVDAAADLPIELCGRIARAVRKLRPDAALFGEVVVDNTHRWTSGALDAATDFGAQEALVEWLCRAPHHAPRAAERLARRRLARGGPVWRHIGFTATHDQARLRSIAQDPRIARLGHLLVLVGPAVPAIYQGDELGLATDRPVLEFEGAWPDRMPVPWEPAGWDRETLELFRAALQARRQCAALRRGDETPGALDEDVLWVRRSWGDEIVDVIAHAGEGTRTVDLPEDAPSWAELLLGLGEHVLDAPGGRLTLGPWSAAVLRRTLPPQAADALSESLVDSARTCEAAFEQGLVASLSLPRRLYVTVTEACNLRCVHCITHAPGRTREGRARVLSPWLLERLGDAFSAAEYFGFAHGGESLTAPIFWDLLAAIGRARSGRPGRHDIHLLTNAMLLSADTTRRLVDHGVTSLAISIDGPDPETNDLIRLGSRLPVLLQHVRDALAVRQERSADLRIGLSVVVGRTNVARLSAIGRLALELGVDWLKIEETAPATPWARRDLLSPHDDRVVTAMARLREVVAGSAMVLVDHLDPPTGCDCTEPLPDALRAFRRADDFANRARFRPCRMAWEQACIDPDGTVHPVDYDHPALGSLHDTPLLALWNGPLIRQLRGSVLARHARRRAGGPVRAVDGDVGVGVGDNGDRDGDA